jgi:hypothetical protein
MLRQVFYNLTTVEAVSLVLIVFVLAFGVLGWVLDRGK